MSSFSFSYRKLKLLFEFYKSTFIYSLTCFIFFFLTFQDVTSGFFFGSIVGLVIVLLIKETNRNKDYLFYINSNLSKVKLYGFSLFINLFISLILLILFR